MDYIFCSELAGGKEIVEQQHLLRYQTTKRMSMEISTRLPTLKVISISILLVEVHLKCFPFDACKSISASFLAGQASSDSHTGDSDFCYPAATACCLCLPPASAFGSNMSSSRRGHDRYQYHKGTQRSHQHRSSHQEYLNRNQQYFHQPVKHSMVIATVFVFFTVAFVGLSYFAFNLQGQISTLSMHLEPGKCLE